MKISRRELKSLVYYKNGELIRKTTNKPIGCKKSNGYFCATINGNHYLLHQLIFLYFNGYIPKIIDHIDHNPSNNNIKNLRECNQKINMLNRGNNRSNSTGFPGVHKRGNKFGCCLKKANKRELLGVFNTAKEAHDFYIKEKDKLIKEYLVSLIFANNAV